MAGARFFLNKFFDSSFVNKKINTRRVLSSYMSLSIFIRISQMSKYEIQDIEGLERKKKPIIRLVK